ncbi:Putative S-adenosyl-L-methionine-dependent methyltransferase superfamily [Colletotrichum destructivum]|uniref:S-adenosyl-L-methionine-dependent methyltransferase superfamily n=1 Tax=Colletotrichum destructivum TaxID=34406 RepID=A0AAX4IC48_9PEZI|nr:Putative S-adenosyl-L-methionine-dependent methyltransferase superfamily [Colletotrichum destructivum]
MSETKDIAITAEQSSVASPPASLPFQSSTAPETANPGSSITSQAGLTNITATIAPAIDPEESIVSSSISVTDSILQYRIENGRTYHKYKDGKYSLPNDERENERLDVQHNMFLLSFDNKLGTAPPNIRGSKVEVKRVLDVGTGTGIWAMEFGDEHPETEVLGIDLSAIQPIFIPPNVKFEIDDVDESWTYSQPFDYIHTRMMTSSIGNWKEYIQKCFDNLEPNGYLELNEIDLTPGCDDGTLKDSHALVKMARLWGAAAEHFGRPFQNNRDLVDIMADVGFVDIHAQTFKWPSNPWPRDKKHKELGYWNHDNSVAGLEAFMMAPFTRVYDWTKEEVTVFAMQVRNEMKDPTIHSYSNIWYIYGRKPER